MITPKGGGIGMTSARGVSTSSDVIRWCFVPSMPVRLDSPVVPTTRIACSLTGMPRFAVITIRFSASPIRIRGAAGKRRFTHTNATSST